MTLTKAELVSTLVDGVGLNQREAREMSDALFELMISELEAGGEIKLSGFGVFSARQKSARPGRNPKTGAAAEISARRVVTFHPSRQLRDRVDAARE